MQLSDEEAGKKKPRPGFSGPFRKAREKKPEKKKLRQKDIPK
jgi:hypothetical protein